MSCATRGLFICRVCGRSRMAAAIGASGTGDKCPRAPTTIKAISARRQGTARRTSVVARAELVLALRVILRRGDAGEDTFSATQIAARPWTGYTGWVGSSWICETK